MSPRATPSKATQANTSPETVEADPGPVQPRENDATLGTVPCGITVTGSTFRSANVERDDAQLVSTYVLTEPALDLLQRIAAKVAPGGRSGAWSVTGAYGIGKSSFAVLLAALLAPQTTKEGASSHEQALRLLDESHPALAASLREAVTAQPMLRGLVTARREPVGRTVARALHAASAHRWGRRPPTKVARALAALGAPETAPVAHENTDDTTPDARAVVYAARTIAAASPLLLLIDEFGKNLEYFASHAEDADASEDLYLLQELAELADGAGGGRGPQVFLLTLQHASFLDYAARTEALQRREWSKIQGRFQDVGFTAGAGDAAALVAGALDQSAISASDAAELSVYGHAAAERAEAHGLESVMVTDPQVLQRAYPLHPMTLAALPLLAGTLGQHDRTLGGFVAGDEPHGVVRFLSVHAGGQREIRSEARPGTDTVLRTLQLPRLWDYFAAAVRGPALASESASRWIEIETRLSEAHGLPELDARILKTVAVLNLVDSSGCLRAGRANITFALTDPQESTRGDSGITERLQQLVERGFLIYREFSDEYRLWRGSTVDLPARMQAARDDLADRDVAELIQQSYAPPAIVAGRHSQTTGMLRHFEARVSYGGDAAVTQVASLEAADGTVVFHLAGADTIPNPAATLPVLVGVSSDAETVLSAGREVAALDSLLKDHDLDAPARTELHERLSVARSELAVALAAAFRPDRDDVEWRLHLDAGSDEQFSGEPGSGDSVVTSDGRVQCIRGARSLSALVSAACDRAYPQSPQVCNEMLGRHQLTSQGAKARRELLTALIEHSDQERAGITGHGPDRAMYDGVVGVLHLHGRLDGGPEPTEDAPAEQTRVVHGWSRPPPGHQARPVWIAAMKMLRSARTVITAEDFYRRLGAPPYGLKAGVVPFVLLAALMETADDVAVFEDGSFVPRLSADMIERMIKTPQRFTLRHIPAGRGQRRAVLDRLHTALLPGENPAGSRGRRTRNSSLVKVVIALLEVVRALSSYATATTDLSTDARQVRQALSTVTDPSELIFTALPEALGHSAVATSEPVDTAGADQLVTDLLAATHELQTADRRLADWVRREIAAAFKLPEDLPTVRRDLAARAHVIGTGLTDPTLASLLAHAQRDELADDDWLDAAVLIIAKSPLASWRPADTRAFPDRARQLARTFDRVYELYFDATRQDGDPFQARRITLTRPDGREQHVVVGLPEAPEPALTALVDELLDRAGTVNPSGADRGHALLAALAERVLSPETSMRPSACGGEQDLGAARSASAADPPPAATPATASPTTRRRRSS